MCIKITGTAKFPRKKHYNKHIFHAHKTPIQMFVRYFVPE